MGREVREAVPIVGDDIKSQVGATITHRVLAKLFEDRGVTVDRTYQLNVGGNMDFKNMLERERLESKKISKTQSVTSQLQEDRSSQRAHRPVGLRRVARRPQVGVRPPRGSQLRRRPLNLEYKLEVWDSRTRASSSTRYVPRRSPRTAASVARSCRRAPTS
jgi:myo-inositol-1-phosphate synthase